MAESRRNPFPYGRELAADELVDREAELEAIDETARNRGKLFLIGPRRYGKTSLLAAAAERIRRRDGIVLRFDTERYETLSLLARAVLTAAARELQGPVERVATVLREVAGRFHPELALDPASGEITVRIHWGEADEEGLPILTEALEAVERMADRLEEPVVVMLDEIQHVVIEHGPVAERQLRSTIQGHRHTVYVFAGSDTRLLVAMTEDPNRPFYRLGTRIFVKEIPRDAFATHVADRFTSSGMRVSEGAITELFEQADDVPYNVQRLAHEVWERLRVSDAPVVTPGEVRHALTDLVVKEDPAYAQLWSDLTVNQKKSLKAVMQTGGREVFAASVSRQLALPVPSLQSALQQLEERQVVRRAPGGDSGAHYRFVDPFLAAWIRRSQKV